MRMLKIITYMLMHVLLFPIGVAYSTDNTHVTKAMFHQSPVTAGNISVEKGILILYFSKDPQIQYVPLSEQDKGHHRLFFPQARVKVTDELKYAIDALNKHHKGKCVVSAEQVNNPSQGLMLTIVCDDKQIGLMYDQFDSIKLEHGVAIRLYDKKVIDALQKQQYPILLTAEHKPRVIIDCGHGGTDFGAVGHSGVREKDITLGIGQRVVQNLQKHDIAVCMTRSEDRSVSLSDRTVCAINPGLFVSIHANSAANVQARGLETYYFSPSLIKKRYVGESTPVTCLDQQLAYRADQSKQLANCVHKEILQTVCVVDNSLNDRKVKIAASQLLAGSGVPTILVEVGFVTNPQEALRLADAKYQDLVAKGIAEGISNYLNSFSCI